MLRITVILKITKQKENKRPMLRITVNSLYSGHCRDLELVSSLASVRNSGSLFQSNICNLFLPGI